MKIEGTFNERVTQVVIFSSLEDADKLRLLKEIVLTENSRPSNPFTECVRLSPGHPRLQVLLTESMERLIEMKFGILKELNAIGDIYDMLKLSYQKSIVIPGEYK